MSPHRCAAFALACFLLPCAPALARTLPIGQVQGSGTHSPLLAREVTVEGVVTADFRDGLQGFFLQDDGDGDARTSDAIFVQAGVDAAVAVGDRLRVHGRVAELAAGDRGDSLTALQDVRIDRRGTTASLPLQVLDAAPTDWEVLEGMRVRIDAPLTIAGVDTLQRFGELTVAFGGRLWQPSEIAVAGTAAWDQANADNARRQLRLDDADTRRDPPSPAWLPDPARLRSGVQLAGVEGIVDQRGTGGYRLQVTAPLALPPLQLPDVPQVAGSLRIAAFNLENLFNGDGRGGGFPTLRGARTHMQYQSQLAKLVATIVPLRADVAAVMELENDGYGADSSIAQLVAALNVAPETSGDWRFVDAGSGPGDNPIRVGILYRASRVTPLGAPAVLEGGPFGEHSRVPLAQAFRGAGGTPFVVVANHFKSKGCSQAAGADLDQGDGQGCWNATRTESARRLHDWLQGDPTGSGSAMTVLLGDLNAYAMESPLRQLRAEGWQDAFVVAGVERPYSYVYNGLSGRLDHALLSPALAARLRGAGEWHINADLPEDAGYQGRNLPGPWRSSDHDPLLLGFDL